jgi:hypothetical protein
MKQPQIKIDKVVHVENGKAYYWKARKDGTFVEASVCCDCSLVHVLQYKPGKAAMRVKVWRDDKLTNKYRKGKKVRLV